MLRSSPGSAAMESYLCHHAAKELDRKCKGEERIGKFHRFGGDRHHWWKMFRLTRIFDQILQQQTQE